MRRAAPLLALVTLAMALLLVGGVSFVSVQGQARASFPGDNGRLVYSRYSRGDLHAVLPDGSAPRRLTAGKIAEDPAWSTDGKVAFARYLRKVPPEIYVKKPGSDRPRRLTDPEPSAFAAHISPPLSKASSEPSGDQAGSEDEPRGVSRPRSFWPEPFEFITQTRSSRSKAIFEPSGDQAGSRSWEELLVRRVGRSLPGFLTYTSGGTLRR